MIGSISQCPSCKNIRADEKGDPKCNAFPKGIPEAIFSAEFDHTKPFKGDKGIRYEPVSKAQEVKF